MKGYLRGCILLTLIIADIGFLLPALFSADDDIAVFSAWALLLATPAGIVAYIRHFFHRHPTKKEATNETE